MPPFAGRIAALEAAGYSNAAAMAKLAHDVVLKAAESCGLRENLAIKGGVVMSSVTGDVRRATMDMDIDFVRYGLSDENIDDWIGRLNCLDGITISRLGEMAELRQQNYRGKRVYLAIADSEGVTISTKTTKCSSAVSRIYAPGCPASSERRHTSRGFPGAGRIGSRPTRHR